MAPPQTLIFDPKDCAGANSYLRLQKLRKRLTQQQRLTQPRQQMCRPQLHACTTMCADGAEYLMRLRTHRQPRSPLSLPQCVVLQKVAPQSGHAHERPIKTHHAKAHLLPPMLRCQRPMQLPQIPLHTSTPR